MNKTFLFNKCNDVTLLIDFNSETLNELMIIHENN